MSSSRKTAPQGRESTGFKVPGAPGALLAVELHFNIVFRFYCNYYLHLLAFSWCDWTGRIKDFTKKRENSNTEEN